MTGAPSSRSVPLHLLYRSEAISADTHAVNKRLAAVLAYLPPPADLAAMREAYSNGGVGIPVMPKASGARNIRIPGPGGEIGLRIIMPPEAARGVYLHIHGGGWQLGTNDMQDSLLESIGRATGLAAVSVDYRLAPEHPYPAAVDDCVTAASWLIGHAQAEFGTGWLAIGGESAGAHLSALTLLRLREQGLGSAFRAACLTYGCYDLSLTPSVRRSSGAVYISREGLEQLAFDYAGTRDLSDPAISPLYADLSGLPPALFSIGTSDPVMDDSLFMHARWQAAGNPAELAIYPGGVHGFNFLEGELAGEANLRIEHFLVQVMEATRSPE